VGIASETSAGNCASELVHHPSSREQQPVRHIHVDASLNALSSDTAVSLHADTTFVVSSCSISCVFSTVLTLQVNSLRKAARKGVLEDLIVHALLRPFDYLDLALRKHADRNHGRRITVIAPDDSAWLVRAFVNSRSAKWLDEVPLDTAVFVGGYHKSIVGELALDVFHNSPRVRLAREERGVKFFSLNDRKGGRLDPDGDTAADFEASISCVSFEEDTESCVLQEYSVDSTSMLGSTSLLSLWVPRVFRGSKL